MTLKEIEQPEHYESFLPEAREALIKEGKEIRVVPYVELRLLLEKGFVELDDSVKKEDPHIRDAHSLGSTEVAFDPNQPFLPESKDGNKEQIIKDYSDAQTARIPGTKAISGDLTTHVLLNHIWHQETGHFLLESIKGFDAIRTSDIFTSYLYNRYYTEKPDPMLLYRNERGKLLIGTGRDEVEGYWWQSTFIFPLIVPLNRSRNGVKEPVTLEDLKGLFKPQTEATIKPTLPKDMEPFKGITGFTTKQMEALVGEGYYIYPSKGRTVQEIAEEFKKRKIKVQFMTDNPDIAKAILSLRSKSCAVAVNPKQFTLDMVGKFEEQKEKVKNLYSPPTRPKGIERSIVDTATFLEIVLQYFKETGHNLLEKYPGKTILTETEIKTKWKDQFVSLGSFDVPDPAFYVRLDELKYINSSLCSSPVNFMCIPSGA